MEGTPTVEKYTLAFVKGEGNAAKIPKHLQKRVYDKDDNVLMGSRYVKGKVAYHYIPAELMETGRPYYLGWGIIYDGKGNIDLPVDAVVLPFDEIVKMFPDNK